MARTSLPGLPPELISAIVDRMMDGNKDTGDLLIDLRAFRAAHRSIAAVMRTHPRYVALRTIQDAVIASWDRTLGQKADGDPPNNFCGLQHWIGSKRLASVCDAVLAMEESTLKTSVVDQFIPVLRQLDGERRRRVFEAGVVFRRRDDLFFKVAISGFARQLKHLEPKMHATLIDKALEMENWSARGDAINGLAYGFRDLDAGCRKRLVDAVLKAVLGNGVYRTEIAGFVDSFGLLTRAQRDELIGASLSVGDPTARAEMIGMLAVGAGSMSPGQRARLMDEILWMVGDRRRVYRNSMLSGAVEAIGGSLQHFDAGRRESFLARVKSSLPWRGRGREAAQASCLAYLAPSLGCLSPEWHERLLEKVVDNKARVRDAAIQGLAEHMEHLSAAQREQLIDATLHLPCPDSEWNERRLRVVSKLAAKLAHMDADQRRRFVEGALSIRDGTAANTQQPPYGTEDKLPRAPKPVLVALAARLGELNPRQRRLVVAAALTRDLGDSRLMVMGSLARQLRELDADQAAWLMAAAEERRLLYMTWSTTHAAWQEGGL